MMQSLRGDISILVYSEGSGTVDFGKPYHLSSGMKLMRDNMNKDWDVAIW